MSMAGWIPANEVSRRYSVEESIDDGHVVEIVRHATLDIVPRDGQVDRQARVLKGIYPRTAGRVFAHGMDNETLDGMYNDIHHFVDRIRPLPRTEIEFKWIIHNYPLQKFATHWCNITHDGIAVTDSRVGIDVSSTFAWTLVGIELPMRQFDVRHASKATQEKNLMTACHSKRGISHLNRRFVWKAIGFL